MGAAGGYLGRLLAGSGLVLDAIEPDAAFAGEARPWYRHVHPTRLEETEISECYGTIIFGDVLEHLVDPQGALRGLMRHLQPDGVVLVSLPNVAHLAVRLLLIHGRYPRMNRGPLDRTHLHHYNRATAERLLADAGLRVAERHATIVPLGDIAGAGALGAMGRATEPLQRLLVRFLPNLLAYQWVFAAEASSASNSRLDRPMTT